MPSNAEIKALYKVLDVAQDIRAALLHFNEKPHEVWWAWIELRRAIAGVSEARAKHPPKKHR